jgi:hypothetical protein
MLTPLSSPFFRRLYLTDSHQFSRVITLARILAENDQDVRTEGVNRDYLFHELGVQPGTELGFSALGIVWTTTEVHNHIAIAKAPDDFWELVDNFQIRYAGPGEIVKGPTVQNLDAAIAQARSGAFSHKLTQAPDGVNEVMVTGVSAETVKKAVEQVAKTKAAKKAKQEVHPDVAAFRDLWNQHKKLTPFKSYNPKRLKKLAELFEEFPDLAQQKAIIQEAERCRFTREDGREWVPDVDWILRDGKAAQMYERSHVDTKDKKSERFIAELDHPSPGNHESLEEALEGALDARFADEELESDLGAPALGELEAK